MKKGISFIFVFTLCLLTGCTDQTVKNESTTNTKVKSETSISRKQNNEIMIKVFSTTSDDPSETELQEPLKDNSIDFAKLLDKKVGFSFRKLDNQYFTYIYVDGEKTDGGTKVTSMTYIFDLQSEEDKAFPYLAPGKHLLTVAQYTSQKDSYDKLDEEAAVALKSVVYKVVDSA